MNTGRIEIVYLQDDEAYVLLHLCGKKKLFCITLHPDSSLKGTVSEENLYPVLSSLYQKGALLWKGDKAVLQEPYRGMIQALSEASYCLIIRKPMDIWCAGAAYPGRNSVVYIERSMTADRQIRLTIMEKKTFLQYLKDADVLPREVDHDERFIKERYSQEDFNKEAGVFFTDPDVCAVIDCYSLSDGNGVERQIIRDAGVYGLVDILTEQGSKCVWAGDTAWLTKWLGECDERTELR